jgi:hypothetical protein
MCLLPGTMLLNEKHFSFNEIKLAMGYHNWRTVYRAWCRRAYPVSRPRAQFNQQILWPGSVADWLYTQVNHRKCCRGCQYLSWQWKCQPIPARFRKQNEFPNPVADNPSDIIIIIINLKVPYTAYTVYTCMYFANKKYLSFISIKV